MSNEEVRRRMENAGWQEHEIEEWFDLARRIDECTAGQEHRREHEYAVDSWLKRTEVG